MAVLEMVKHGPGDDGHGTSTECPIGTQELPAHLREMKKAKRSAVRVPDCIPFFSLAGIFL